MNELFTPLVDRMNREQLKQPEKQLWSAADNLRANSGLKANQYSTPILGLIFLRFADNIYRGHEAEINAEFQMLSGTRREKPISDIAKVGHKYYPNEFVTEHLITRIGQAIGLDIADSRLAHVKGQLRFLSRYFLRDNEYMLHGADIFASYLQDHGREFVEAVENENKAPEFFDYDFAVESINAMVPQSAAEVQRGFNRMLAFDALVGNNDRHFFNWAVVCHPLGHRKPRFSPVFDTARALFWNHTEEKLSKMSGDGRRPEDVLRKYCRNSSSKIGAAGGGRVNHFGLLESVLDRFPDAASQLDLLSDIDREPVDLVGEILKEEFRDLVSPLRRSWICRLVEYRTDQFRHVLAGEKTDV